MTADLVDDLTTTEPPKPRPRFTAFGVVLLLLGIAAIGWVGWQFLGTTLIAKQHYAAELAELRTTWDLGEPPPLQERPAAGQAYAILRVPEFGERFEVPIIAGVDGNNLTRGVAAYPSSVHPGENGNFALAGYRTTYAGPFSGLLKLKAGDEVIIETRDAVHTYVIDVPASQVTVGDHDAWVLDPVPGRPGAVATQPTITLTTSQDVLASADRSVAFGHLASTRNK